MSCVQNYITHWSEPESTALDTPEGVLTWAKLVTRIERACGLLRSHGIAAGDVVAVQLTRALAPFELHLGALALGAATVPLNDTYTNDEVSYILDNSQAKLACLIGEGAEYTPSKLRAALDAARSVAIPQALDPATIAAIPYTSGTTGRPKGALITHGNLLAMLEALHHAWRWSNRDSLLHALPMFHIHGLFVAQHSALYAGARSTWLGRFDAEEVLARLGRREATVFMGVPTFYQRMLDAPGTYDLSGVRLFTSGSAALPTHVHQKFHSRFGHAILERYGLTEAGIVLSNPYDGERRPGTVGFPLAKVEARLIAADGTPTPFGGVGEIELRGPSIFQGYLRQPEKSAASLRDGWLRTGDLATTDSDGYFRIVGRSRDLVISGGFNVYPSEIESAFADHPGVRELAVVGAPDADLGERPVGTVVPEPGCTFASLEAWAAVHLAPYKRPRAWQFADALPRNAMGKVMKTELELRWRAPQVRQAEVRDLAAIVRANRAMAEETEALVLDPDTARAGVLAVLDQRVDAVYFIAEVAGGYAGQCMVTREWSDWRNAHVHWIQSVYVHPTFRMQGLYRQLYAAVVRAARSAGAAGVRLYVDRRNTAAAAVYAKLGMNGDHYGVFEAMFFSETEGNP